MNRGAKTPGLLLMAAAVVALVVCLASFAERAVTVGVGAAVVALLATGAGFAWLGMDSRRVRQVEREWSNVHHGGAESSKPPLANTSARTGLVSGPPKPVRRSPGPGGAPAG